MKRLLIALCALHVAHSHTGQDIAPKWHRVALCHAKKRTTLFPTQNYETLFSSLHNQYFISSTERSMLSLKATGKRPCGCLCLYRLAVFFHLWVSLKAGGYLLCKLHSKTPSKLTMALQCTGVGSSLPFTFTRHCTTGAPLQFLQAFLRRPSTVCYTVGSTPSPSQL